MSTAVASQTTQKSKPNFQLFLYSILILFLVNLNLYVSESVGSAIEFLSQKR